MPTEVRPVLLLAATGFVIRNLLLGKFLDAILKDYPLLVAVPDPEDPRLQALVAGKPVKLIPFFKSSYAPLENYFQKLQSWEYWMFYLKRAEKNTRASEITHRLYDTRHTFFGAGAIQILTFLGKLVKWIGGMGSVEAMYLRYVAKWDVTQTWIQLLKKHQPIAVVSTLLSLANKNYPSVDLPAIAAAHQMKIACGILVQSWDNLSSKTAVLPPWLDRYWTWSTTQTEELGSLYPRIPKERINVVGSPQFDFHSDPAILESRENYCQRLGLDAAKPYFLIGTGTPLSLPYEPELVLDLIRTSCEKYPRYQILLRLHPKDDAERWLRYEDEIKKKGVILQKTAPSLHMDRGGFIPPQDFYREQVNAIFHAFSVLNSSSTLTVDAAIINRPVICLAYDVMPDSKFPEGRARLFSQTDHYSRLVKTGGVTVVYSKEECLEALSRYLQNPALHREGRKKIVGTVTQQADGKSGERLAAAVVELASKSRTGS